MAIESDGHSRGNPRLYELIENAPKTGKSPTIWAWPEVVDWLRVAGQPVPGPWPPHQRARPNPEEESLPVAVVEPPRPEDIPTNVPSDVPSSVTRQETAPRQETVPPQETSAPRHYGDMDEPPARHGVGLLDIE
jgi:hypothetical protein